MDNNTRWESFNSIIDNEELDLKEKGLLLVIFRYVNYKTGYADPSRALIKKLTGIKKDETLDKILDSLIEKEFIIREVTRGKRSKYFIIIPLKNGGTPKNGGAPNNSSTPPLKNGGTLPPKNGGQKENKRKVKENIYSHWNSKKIIFHKLLTTDMEKAIEKALKKYSESEIVQAMNTYSEILESDFYFNYKWNLVDFLNRKNGISTFMEDGSNKANYDDYLSKKMKGKDNNNEKQRNEIKLRGWD